MKLDNFTTLKCSKCGFVKQFQPGKEYEAKDFMCNCKAKEVPKIDTLKKVAKGLGINFRSDIKEETLAKKIKEVQDGKSKATTKES